MKSKYLKPRPKNFRIFKFLRLLCFLTLVQSICMAIYTNLTPGFWSTTTREHQRNAWVLPSSFYLISPSVGWVTLCTSVCGGCIRWSSSTLKRWKKSASVPLASVNAFHNPRAHTWESCETSRGHQVPVGNPLARDLQTEHLLWGGRV